MSEENSEGAVAGQIPSEEEKKGLTRRELLAAGTVGAATLALGSELAAQIPEGPGSPEAIGEFGSKADLDVYKAMARGSSSEAHPWRPPRSISSREGVLTHFMDATWTPWRFVCNGREQRHFIRVYNHDVPGAALFVDPGDRLDLKLHNQLPPNRPETCEQLQGKHNQPKCFNTTNLHTHGLLVSPRSLYDSSGKPILSSDDINIKLEPGSAPHPYCIQLPSFHAPGTHWYHAHVHGSTAVQVANGMAGPLIIREPAGQELVPPDRDKVWMLQEVVFGEDRNGVPAVYGTSSGTVNSAGFLVNGLCQPLLQMAANRTERWRFINGTGTPRGLFNLRLLKVDDNPEAIISGEVECGPTERAQTMHLVAVDGISFYQHKPQPVKGHLMAPGNRADFLVNLPVGKYKLVKCPFPYDADPASAYKESKWVNASKNSIQVLAYVEVHPSTYRDPIPDRIPGTPPAYLQAITRASPRAAPISFENPASADFRIDGKHYNPADPPLQVPLGATQEWTLRATQTSRRPNPMPHPYHIHVNPFQVVGRKIDPRLGDDPRNWMWMDTVPIPFGTVETPGEVKIRSRFQVYDGKFVIHCHTLTHEDRGMMRGVEVVGRGVGPCQPVGG